jgi:uncharacterized protein YbjT (DUF2867 family)
MKAREVLGNGFEVIEGNAANRDDLQTALAGCIGVHISLSPDSELVAATHIAALAPASSLERVTYVSATTAVEEHRWFEMIDVKLRAEEVVRNSGVPYTIFCPTWVMETLPNFVHGRRAFAVTGKQPIPLHFFAAEEFGRMVAAAYEMEETVGKRLYIHGPEAIPLREAIDRLVTACYPEIKKVTVLPVWLARVVAVLMSREGLKFVSRLISYYDKVGEIGDPTEANELLGAPSITLNAWCRMRGQHTGMSRRSNGWTPPSG